MKELKILTCPFKKEPSRLQFYSSVICFCLHENFYFCCVRGTKKKPDNKASKKKPTNESTRSLAGVLHSHPFICGERWYNSIGVEEWKRRGAAAAAEAEKLQRRRARSSTHGSSSGMTSQLYHIPPKNKLVFLV